MISPTSQYGFTLIEMIVSLAVFSMVATVSVGALLVLISSNEQLQSEQSVMTNLSFALDSMTREIRTGTHYFCGSGNNKEAVVGAGNRKIFLDNEVLNMGNETKDCHLGNDGGLNFHGIAFIEGGESITGAANTRIVYFFDANENKIYRRVSGEEAQSIVSSGIHIEKAEFFVTGSEPLSDTDENQAIVTVFIEAREKDGATKPYQIQTTITQRTLDI